MGSPGALCVSIPAAAVLNSPNSPSRPWLDGRHVGHGCGSAPLMLTTRKNCGVLRTVPASSNRPWRMELLSGGGVLTDMRVRASSSEEPSGDKGQVKTEDVPGWSKLDSEELPPWAKNERSASQEPARDLPFPVYFLGSTLVAIAAIGSVFEYFNQNPVFGVIYPDSPLYIPIVGFFAITGLPSAGFLFYKSIQLANKASEEADKEDGFRR